MVAFCLTAHGVRRKENKNGVAVDKKRRSKEVFYRATARVSGVAARKERLSNLYSNNNLICRGVAQFGRALRSGYHTERFG